MILEKQLNKLANITFAGTGAFVGNQIPQLISDYSNSVNLLEKRTKTDLNELINTFNLDIDSLENAYNIAVEIGKNHYFALGHSIGTYTPFIGLDKNSLYAGIAGIVLGLTTYQLSKYLIKKKNDKHKK